MVEGDFGSEHKGRRGGVTVEGKGTERREEQGWGVFVCVCVGGGVMNQLASLLLCKCYQSLLRQGRAHDWWAGLNCKVHFWLMAVAARL